MSIETRNYYADPRVACQPAAPPVLYREDDNGAVYEEGLPMCWVVCPVCNGAGTHVNPSIDAGGISGEEFAEDPDFAEAYMAGEYDQQCNQCGGRSTIQAPDWDAMAVDTKRLYERQLAEEAADHACHMAELRAGA